MALLTAAPSLEKLTPQGPHLEKWLLQNHLLAHFMFPKLFQWFPSTRGAQSWLSHRVSCV